MMNIVRRTTYHQRRKKGRQRGLMIMIDNDNADNFNKIEYIKRLLC